MKENKNKLAWEAIIQAIRARKAERNERNADIARLLDVDRATVGNWLSGVKGGERTPVNNMLRYMKKLGIDPTPYFGLDTQNEELTKRIEELEKENRELKKDLLNTQKDLLTAKEEALKLYRERGVRPSRNLDDVGNDVPTSSSAARSSHGANKPGPERN